MSDTGVAYIAGFFDGEGSIFISKSKKQYFLTVSISNTNLHVLEEVQKIIGGNISKSPDNRENSSELFKLRLYCNEAKKFLEKILPYLKIKKEQAKLAIEFQSKMEKGKRTIPKDGQEKYRTLINSFNKKKKRKNL
ncbi:MAG: LAGLIDADG family homing endonuclease [Candidatus Asgardarchaeia archaeon]